MNWWAVSDRYKERMEEIQKELDNMNEQITKKLPEVGDVFRFNYDFYKVLEIFIKGRGLEDVYYVQLMTYGNDGLIEVPGRTNAFITREFVNYPHLWEIVKEEKKEEVSLDNPWKLLSGIEYEDAQKTKSNFVQESQLTVEQALIDATKALEDSFPKLVREVYKLEDSPLRYAHNPFHKAKHQGHEVVDNIVAGKEFKYCRDCKEEV